MGNGLGNGKWAGEWEMGWGMGRWGGISPRVQSFHYARWKVLEI